MVALTQEKINEAFARFVDELVKSGAVNLTKTDIKNAVSTTDAWIDANATSYNNSLPANVRTALTANQKAILFAFVALRKY